MKGYRAHAHNSITCVNVREGESQCLHSCMGRGYLLLAPINMCTTGNGSGTHYCVREGEIEHLHIILHVCEGRRELVLALINTTCVWIY